MNGTITETRSLIAALRASWQPNWENVEVAVCPPFTSLPAALDALKDLPMLLGGQNCHHESSGAFTGEISPAMLNELGCAYVILGHSERRTLFGETDAMVSLKAAAAIAAGLKPIVCVGETEDQRAKEETNEVLARQIKGSLADVAGADLVTVAYEPVWAIGTGKTATAEQAQEAHAFIRAELRKKFGSAADGIRIQYGGSVKPDNAMELFSCSDIDGGLIGGASLKAESFLAIIAAASSVRNSGSRSGDHV
jgi:triosephosphate isomerase